MSASYAPLTFDDVDDAKRSGLVLDEPAKDARKTPVLYVVAAGATQPRIWIVAR